MVDEVVPTVAHDAFTVSEKDRHPLLLLAQELGGQDAIDLRGAVQALRAALPIIQDEWRSILYGDTPPAPDPAHGDIESISDRQTYARACRVRDALALVRAALSDGASPRHSPDPSTPG